MQTLVTGVDGWPVRAARAGWCVITLAEQRGWSVSTLERHFEEAFGVSPHDWVLAHRLRRARELLERGELVKNVAAALRYDHPQIFSRAFKRYHGYSPKRHTAKVRGGGGTSVNGPRDIRNQGAKRTKAVWGRHQEGEFAVMKNDTSFFVTLIQRVCFPQCEINPNTMDENLCKRILAVQMCKKREDGRSLMGVECGGPTAKNAKSKTHCMRFCYVNAGMRTWT